MNADPLWSAVEAVLERADADAIRAHGLGPLAAARWRHRGEEAPAEFAREARSAHVANLIAPELARRIRASFGEPLVLFKGPEVAARYPDRARVFTDMDILAADASAARRALVAAGFEDVQDPEGRYSGIHHLVPVQLAELPLPIELHSSPKWPAGLRPPSVEDILREAVPSATGDGALRAPAPHHHALLLAAHAWAHTPLETVRDLLDIAAVVQAADLLSVRATADAWGIGRLWRTTEAAIDWLFYGGRRPLSTRIWARHLHDLREARVIEQHLEYWLSCFWMLPARQATVCSVTMVRRDLSRAEGETRVGRARRIARIASHAGLAKSVNDAIEGREPERRELARR